MEIDNHGKEQVDLKVVEMDCAVNFQETSDAPVSQKPTESMETKEQPSSEDLLKTSITLAPQSDPEAPINLEDLEDETDDLTWRTLPLHIKEHVLTWLDYKTKFRLRVCSKSEKQLIDNVPISFPHMSFEVIESLGNPNSLSCRLNLTEEEHHHRLYIYGQIAIDHFLGIFGRGRSEVNELVINNGFSEKDHSPLKTLIRLCKTMRPNFRVRTKSISLMDLGKAEYVYPEIFKLLHPEFLRQMEFTQSLSRETMEKMAETESWKSAKIIKCKAFQSMPIDWVLHANELELTIRNINGDDIKKLIDRYTKGNNLERGQGFFIRCDNDLAQEDIPCLNAPSIPKNQNRDFYPYIQRFPTNRSNLVFILKIGSFRITGYVCYRTNQDADFKSLVTTGMESFRSFFNINDKEPPADPTPPPSPTRHEETLDFVDPPEPVDRNPPVIPRGYVAIYGTRRLYVDRIKSCDDPIRRQQPFLGPEYLVPYGPNGPCAARGPSWYLPGLTNDTHIRELTRQLRNPYAVHRNPFLLQLHAVQVGQGAPIESPLSRDRAVLAILEQIVDHVSSTV